MLPRCVAVYALRALASSAFDPVQVWDLSTGKCEHTLKHHTDKARH